MTFNHNELIERVNAKKVQGEDNLYIMFKCLYLYVPSRNVFVYVKDA